MKPIRCLLLIFLPLLFSSTLVAQEKLLPLKKPDSRHCQAIKKNRIKVALRFGYLADNREAGSLRSRTEYNPAGHPLLVYQFNDAGQIHKKSNFVYDTSDTLIVQANTQEYDAHSELVYSRSYQYSAEGLLEAYQVTNSKGQTFRIGYTYDLANHLLSEQTFEPGGLPGASTLYTYNAGHCTEIIAYGLGQAVKKRTTFRFDEKGRSVEETHFLQSNIQLFRLVSTYDENGKILRKDRFSRNNKPIGFESWQYNAANLVVLHEIQEPGDAAPLREVTHYDAQGRKSEFISYETDGSIFQWFKYDYDRTGTGEGYRRLKENGSLDMRFQEIYDAQGRIIARNTLYPDGSGDLKISFRYDNAGLLMEEVHTSFAQETATYWFVFERY